MSKITNREPTVERINKIRSIQDDYTKFKNKIAIKRAFDPISELNWTYYENFTSKNVSLGEDANSSQCIVLLHGICGTAGCYFYLFDKLTELGYRCISAQYPEYLTPSEWVSGFLHFIEYLNIKKPAVFASDLGGFLLQLFIERYPDIINSIVLCNSYRRTDLFSNTPEFRELYGNFYAILPHMLLRNIFIESYICPQSQLEDGKIELSEQYAREFMANELDELSANDLGSRITLQLTNEVVSKADLSGFQQHRILLIETFNNTLPDELNDDIRNWYPNAKVATMKTGGDFPYLTRPDEVAIFLQIHLNNMSMESSGRIDDVIHYNPSTPSHCSSSSSDDSTSRMDYLMNNSTALNIPNYESDGSTIE